MASEAVTQGDVRQLVDARNPITAQSLQEIQAYVDTNSFPRRPSWPTTEQEDAELLSDWIVTTSVLVRRLVSECIRLRYVLDKVQLFQTLQARCAEWRPDEQDIIEQAEEEIRVAQRDKAWQEYLDLLMLDYSRQQEPVVDYRLKEGITKDD